MFLKKKILEFFMPNNNFSKESSELVNKIRNLNFVKEAHTESVNPVNKHNFENTINYNKKEGYYNMSVTLGRSNYKIRINVDKPNPKYEKCLKRLIN
jgi:hypothetical protein